MNAPPSEPENQLWGIYFRDREYAKLLGDPLRMVIEAPTKAAAEDEANRLGFSEVWAHPVTAEQANHAERFSRTPTVEQISTAIEVLEKLAEKMDVAAAHSIEQLPESKSADKYAEHLETMILEQTASIKSVAAKLRNWQDELAQKSKQTVSHHV
ncbi:MAG TPA: hypothetical protein VGM58_07070 [Verrucomicrobiae bacterium]